MVELGCLTPGELNKLYRLFRRVDEDKDGVLPIKDFFQDVCAQELTMFSDGLLQLVGLGKKEALSFGEFCRVLVVYCLFEKKEILEFIWSLLDQEKTGFAHKDDFIIFVEVLHISEKRHKTALSDTLKALPVDKNRKFNIDELKEFHFLYPQLLEPAFDMQLLMMQKSLGADYWAIRKLDLAQKRKAQLMLEEQLKLKQLAMLEKQRQAAIRRDMGFLRYYAAPGERELYDVKYPRTTAEQLEKLDTKKLQAKLKIIANAADNGLEAQQAFEYVNQQLRAKRNAAIVDGETSKTLSKTEQAEIVAAYRAIDVNFKEISNAKKEGRRFRIAEESHVPGSRAALSGVKGNFYRRRIMKVSRNKVSTAPDPDGDGNQNE